MDFEPMQAFLNEAKWLKEPERERSLFDIGARGYFENPTSDLLSFFVDPDAEHGFGNAILSALLDCFPEKLQPALDQRYLKHSPDREWVTSLNQRIDLVLESERWVLAIEHKIYHVFRNDFSHYGEDLSQRLSGQNNRQILCAVLSPGGQAPNAPGWIGISYADFLPRLRSTTGFLYEQYGENKWLVFLREFLLHLEKLTMTRTFTDAQEKYVLKHLGEIDALTQAKEAVLDSLRHRLQEGVNSRLDDSNSPITSWKENWPIGPALRFAPQGWQGYSNVVVFLDKERPGTVRVQPYIDKKNGGIDKLREHGIDIDRLNFSHTCNYYLLFQDFDWMNWEAVEKAVMLYLRAIIRMETDWQRKTQKEAKSN